MLFASVFESFVPFYAACKSLVQCHIWFFPLISQRTYTASILDIFLLIVDYQFNFFYFLSSNFSILVYNLRFFYEFSGISILSTSGISKLFKEIRGDFLRNFDLEYLRNFDPKYLRGVILST